MTDMTDIIVAPTYLQLAQPPTLALAQGSPPATSSQAMQVAMWVGVLIVLVVAGSMVALWLRRRMLAKDNAGQEMLTLSDLRAMRDRGQLSSEEYDAMRAKMAQKAGEAVAKDPKVQAQLEALRKARAKKPAG